LPDELLVVLVARGDEYLVPSGGTRLAEGDALLVLCDRRTLEEIAQRLGWRLMEK
jgi:Trk K+ transport system NAD-binding subunit